MKHLLFTASIALASLMIVPALTYAAEPTLVAVFAVGDDRNRVCLGDGNGGFSCSDVSEDANPTWRVAAGLVDGDDNLDAVFANKGTPNRVCLGNGVGGFSCSNVSSNTTGTICVALGFVDGDGNLDAVFGNRRTENRVCLGDGNGGFSSCSNVSGDTDATEAVALGFVDGDANLDAVFANDGTPNRVCLGNGSGGFSCSDVSDDNNVTSEVVLGLVNGDGNLDAIFGNGHDTENRVCLGDGNGGFSSCFDVSGDTNNTVGGALGFIDNDGNLDVVFANIGQRNRVCLGGGSGGFSCSNVSGDTNNSERVTLGFVDGDGSLDAVFANADQRNRVCFGNGTGGFSSCSDVSEDANQTFGVALGDATEAQSSDFKSGFEVEDFADWDDHFCPACNRIAGFIREGTSLYPQSSSYETDVPGEHRAIVQGPPDVNFDLYLWWWDGSEWSPVAFGNSSLAKETVSFYGDPGLYRWEVRSVSGHGEFLLVIEHTDLALDATNQLTRSRAARKKGTFGLESVYFKAARNRDYLIDVLPVDARSYEASFWIKPVQGLAITGKKHQIFQLLRGNKTMLKFYLWPPGTAAGDYRVAARIRLGNGGFSAPETADLSTDKWQRITVRWKASSAPESSDGHLLLLRDGQPVGSLESLDNYAHRINRVHLGQATRGAKKTSGQVCYEKFQSKWED